MNSSVIIGLLLGALISSLVANVALYLTRYSATRVWRARTREAEDARKAAELRSADQIDAMLDRLRTNSRLELAGAPAPITVDPDARRYIPDTEDADQMWDEYRGVEPADEGEN